MLERHLKSPSCDLGCITHVCIDVLFEVLFHESLKRRMNLSPVRNSIWWSVVMSLDALLVPSVVLFVGFHGQVSLQFDG